MRAASYSMRDDGAATGTPATPRGIEWAGAQPGAPPTTPTGRTGRVVQGKRCPFAHKYVALALYRALFVMIMAGYSTATPLFPMIISPSLTVSHGHGLRPCVLLPSPS